MWQGKNNLYLIGFMGAGKSTVARVLARQLDRQCVDTDELVETREGMSISDIFQEHGEAHFRKVEASVLREVADRDGVIAAVGGGAVLRQENWTTIRKSGTSVYLDWPEEVLIARILNNDKRPLVAMLPSARRRQQLRQLFTTREPIYSQADIHISCAGSMTPQDIAALIENRIGKNR